MESIFKESAYNEVLERINNLDEHTQPIWGKMSVGQMAHHCQGPLNIILLRNDYGLKPNWLLNLFFKKSMYSDKLWKKNLPTAKAFKEIEGRDFNTEKAQLVNLLNELHTQKDKTDWHPHPSFGDFTAEQWGKSQYKHLDHHLRQFGV